MAELITMPKLGFDMAEGTLVRWLKAEGDPLKKGEVIAEIETDKATVEVESGYAGVMLRHLADEGADLPVNAPIAIVADEGEALSDDEIDALLAGADVKAPGKPVSKDEKAVQAAKRLKKPLGMIMAKKRVKPWRVASVLRRWRVGSQQNTKSH